MSENNSNNNNKKQSHAALISTIIVAVAAVAAVVVLLLLKNSNKTTLSDGTEITFRPSSQLVEECNNEAHDLISKSYDVIRLFVTEGLPHLDEPYGNDPEDGIYTVNSEKYTSLQQIEDLVKSVYTDEAADKILHNLDGNGLEVYKNREIYVEAEYTDDVSDSDSSVSSDATSEVTTETSAAGSSETSAAADSNSNRPAFVKKTVLGISADFTPDTSRSALWSQLKILPTPISDTECALTIYLDSTTDSSAESDTGTSAASGDSGTSDSGNDLVLETRMVKTNGQWRLTDFVY